MCTHVLISLIFAASFSISSKYQDFGEYMKIFCPIFCLLYHVGILPGLGIRISPDGLDLSLFGFCTALWPFDHFASDQPCSKSLSTIFLLSLFQNIRLSDEALLESPTTIVHLSPFQNLKATRVRDTLNLEPCMVIKSKIEQARILLFLEPTILPSASQQT